VFFLIASCLATETPGLFTVIVLHTPPK